MIDSLSKLSSEVAEPAQIAPLQSPSRLTKGNLLELASREAAMLSGSSRANERGSVTSSVTNPQSSILNPQSSNLVLSLFPGIDLLGRGFELEGYCVVRGPDLIYGSCIEDFRAPSGHFSGVIGGSPCQDFSLGNPKRGTGEGIRLLNEWARVVTEAQPDWWLLENVSTVPDLQAVAELSGYAVQRFDLNSNECGLAQDRLRHFQFGSKAGLVLLPERQTAAGHSRVCTATEARRGRSRRSWQEFCELQGLPRDFQLPGWTQEAAYRAVGNGVSLPVARVLARAVTAAVEGRSPASLALFSEEYRSAIAESHNVHLRTVTVPGLCRCGCGRPLRGKQKHASAACRKRMQRQNAGYVRPLSRVKGSVEQQKQELR